MKALPRRRAGCATPRRNSLPLCVQLRVDHIPPSTHPSGPYMSAATLMTQPCLASARCWAKRAAGPTVLRQAKTLARNALAPRYQVPLKYWYGLLRRELEEELALLPALVRPGEHIIDVGGNRG